MNLSLFPIPHSHYITILFQGYFNFQVSLGKMTVDIYKYITVFAIIICSFAAGLARFYQYYDGMVYQDEFGMKTVQVCLLKTY